MQRLRSFSLSRDEETFCANLLFPRSFLHVTHICDDQTHVRDPGCASWCAGNATCGTFAERRSDWYDPDRPFDGFRSVGYSS